MTAHRARGLFLTAAGTLEVRLVDLPAPGPGAVRVPDIAGRCDAASEGHDALVGRPVLVPAVIPCDACALCRAGRDTACTAQLMPGNDVHGGFATHVVVPARHLVPLPDDLTGDALAELSALSDAVTTPYQALRRAGVSAGDLVVIL